MVYVLVAISVASMSAAQLLLKRGLVDVGQFPGLRDVVPFFLKAYTNGYVIGSVLLTVVTALAWVSAVSKGELSRLYPFMALSYVLVALFSQVLFNEGVTTARWIGIAVICVGVALVSRT